MVLDEKISIGHFVYTTIIALLIITFTLVLAFGGNKDAGNQVNVMATGISIILAVIAILMTLVDVAGQRQSIIDIKETAEKLMNNQKVSDETLEKSIETLEFLSNFKEEMLSSVTEFKDLTEERLKELLNKGTIDKSDLDEALKYITRESSQLDSKLRFAPKFNISADQIDNVFKNLIERVYPDTKKIFKELPVFMADVEFLYGKSSAKEMLKFLKNKNMIMINPKNEKDYVYINVDNI
ncbi:hypothetical protein ABEW02_13875 [Bacillus safensis]|uniref:hypothetical protein n=1 Tax=Bacillus safensis TaxID=561879 RepID=UPI000C763BA2|nr:hypothetical protein [Bacillus safensis]PLT38320.1 hypothetical protein CUU65_07750 [Bacillus safensis]